MTSNRFFIEKLKLDTSPFLFLSGKEHHHLSRVARTRPKETVWLFDGKGTNYLARVEEISREKTRLKILKTVVSTEPKVKIYLGQAILKARKMEDVLQKATDLGIAAFIPIRSERSIIKIHDRARKRTERWEKIAREAADITKEAAQATGSVYHKGALSTELGGLKTVLGKWLTWLRK